MLDYNNRPKTVVVVRLDNDSRTREGIGSGNMRTRQVILFSTEHQRLAADGWTLLGRNTTRNVSYGIMQEPPPELETDKSEPKWWDQNYDEGVGEV